jgi:hypothetical protein
MSNLFLESDHVTYATNIETAGDATALEVGQILTGRLLLAAIGILHVDATHIGPPRVVSLAGGW